MSVIHPVSGEIRSDSAGDGHFAAPRRGRMRRIRLHRGVDLEVTPDAAVVAPADGTVVRTGKCYSTHPQFDLVEIDCGPVVHRILYVEPSVSAGDQVRAGQTIGLAQDVRLRYGDTMQPHVHWEARMTDVVMGKGRRPRSSVWFNPLILRTFAALTAAILAAVGVSGECPVSVPPGWHTVQLTSYYAHVDPGDRAHLYQAETTMPIRGPGVASPASQGHPIGHRWAVDGVITKTCGELPLFLDGFESGTTSGWGHEVSSR